MATIESSVPGTVSWVDLQTPDLDKARKFYGELLGWSFVGGDDVDTGYYTMSQLRERNVAGLMKRRDDSPFPSIWSVYFAVEDADDVTRKVTEFGGQVVMPPLDVMDAGRMAVFCDPTGAYFGVWQAKNHKGAQVVDEPGAMAWHEVYTRDATKARQFYTRVFGLEANRLDAPGIDYWTLHKAQKTVCGVMQMEEEMPKEVPPHWNVYFSVKNVDACEKKLVELGGNVITPAFDTSYGRIAVVTDPFGAMFSLMTPPSVS